MGTSSTPCTSKVAAAWAEGRRGKETLRQGMGVEEGQESIGHGKRISSSLPHETRAELRHGSSKLLKLHGSMVPRLSYKARPERALRPATNRAYTSSIAAAEQLTSPLCSRTASAQLRLPLHVGGLGVSHATIFHNAASCLSANALADATMADTLAHL
jgi:hypothetical protein